MEGTLVPVTSTSLASPVGKSLQLSEQGAVAISSMLTERLSCGKSETVIVLVSLLIGITENTTSSDVLALASYRAKDICLQAGISEEDFLEVLRAYADIAQRLRSWNPFAF